MKLISCDKVGVEHRAETTPLYIGKISLFTRDPDGLRISHLSLPPWPLAKKS